MNAQPFLNPVRVAPTPLPSDTLPAVWSEILPITLREARVTYLRRHCDGAAGTWYEPQAGSAHPSTRVRAQVATFFGAGPGTVPLVVHSTAWRYEADSTSSPRLLLTYLVVLPPWGEQTEQRMGDRLHLEPVDGGAPLRSAPLAPPERIERCHVLAHALDHLALLVETDQVIACALGHLWRQTLVGRWYRPAGELHLAPARFSA